MENKVRNKIAKALKEAILVFCLNSPPFDIQWFAIWIFHHISLSHLLQVVLNFHGVTSILYREKKKDH